MVQKFYLLLLSSCLWEKFSHVIFDMDGLILGKNFSIRVFEKVTKIYLNFSIFVLGVKKLIHHLKEHNVPIALASGSLHKDYLLKTAQHDELFQLFPIKVFGDDPDLKRGKPFPDQFILTSSKFADSPMPDNVLVFEDSPNGVLAAKAAGMGVVMVPDRRLDEKLYNNSTQVIFSLEDFKPELFGFPCYD
ncbi:pseudouridine-5'-phosphatase-like [Clytia hemisphaerica]|uniref:pseudouridine-5'-phosphatase-like n=1 Tax=Clytia hemisphaerica TaxID=252671 RepID=UPI0034D506E1